MLVLSVRYLEEGNALKKKEEPVSDPAIGKHGQLAQGGDDTLDALLAVAVGHQARVLVMLLQDALAQNPARDGILERRF